MAAAGLKEPGKGSQGGHIAVDGGGGQPPVMAQVIDKGLEIRLLQALDMGTGFPEVLAIQAVFKGGYGVIPVGVRTIFQ